MANSAVRPERNLTSLWGHPFAIEGDLPFATLTNLNIRGTNNSVAGGLVDPVFNLTYFITADQNDQRCLGITNYFYLQLGRSFDNQATFNAPTARQFTDVPQVGYTEGLGKFLPALNGVFFDLVRGRLCLGEQFRHDRSWRLSLIGTNQHVSQIPGTFQNAVFRNAGTLIAFRVGGR